MHFNSRVAEITANSVTIVNDRKVTEIKNDYVFAMIGYHPDHEFLKSMGIVIDEETGRPIYDEVTMESNVKGLYIAGVIAAGNNANEIFIENGRLHGAMIAASICSEKK